MTDIKEVLVKTLSNVNLWGAILATLIIIGIGFVLTKMNVLKKEWKGSLSKVVLSISVPALALQGFMGTASLEQLKQQGIILGVAFAFYILLSICSVLWIKFFPESAKKASSKMQNNTIANPNGSLTEKRALIIWMMLIFGSTTFFGLPVIKSLYPTDGVISANMWNIPYRIFLYSFAFIMVSGVRVDRQNIKKAMKTAFVNPIVIATFIGLVCWLTTMIPGAATFGEKGTAGWFELKVTAPWIYKTVEYLGSLASPLTWIAIGITLASSNLKLAVKDKWVWIFSLQKLILIPLIVFLVMLGLNYGGFINREIAISMVIFASVPPATVVILYAIQYKTQEEFAAQCSALSTLLAVIILPIWVIISNVVFM